MPAHPFRRVAIAFDDRIRPETTGVYCRKALKSLAEVEFFHPDAIASIPRNGFDLYLVIDDGLDYAWPADLHPCAYWAIDTHMDFDRCLRRARQFDFVFAAQKDGAERLLRAGIVTACWLPLACDEEIHGKQDVAKEYDVCFVGNLFPGPRTDLVRLIQQYFPKSFVGRAYFEEMARAFSASKIVFNRSLRNDINMRVFEALASGSLLITNDLTDNGQHKLLRDGVQLATYTGSDDLLDKLRYYLKREELRERIAAAGRAEVLAKHTYTHRMRQILATVLGTCEYAGVENPAAESIARCRLPHTRESIDALCLMPAAQSQIQIEDEAPKPALQKPSPCGDGPVANNREVVASHDSSYFDFARPEMLALIPMSARAVLEIGCGHGRLGESLKARQPCEVTGIELDERAAAVARGRLDLVFAGDIGRLESKGWEAYFDVVTLGDVLEHLVDPARQLARIRSWLKSDGVVIASIPNVRHHGVVRSLLEGNWTYEPAGILDETHLHFFTKRTIQATFEATGFKVRAWSAVPGPGYDEWVQQGRSRTVDLGRVRLTDLPEEEAEEFYVYQWLIVATAAAATTHGKHEPNDERGIGRGVAAQCSGDSVSPLDTSPPAGAGGQPAEQAALEWNGRQSTSTNRLPSCVLLMVTYNRLEYTKLALEAMLAIDYPDLRIVIWDNASTDGTVAYLQQRLAAEDHARLIASPANRGIVFPMNAVWLSDHGAELVAKIDNDTWVPPDLLRRLAECHRRSRQFGVLSGFHFRAEGEALADDSRVSEIDGVRILAQPYVGGCAVVVRREVLDRLGPIPCRNDAQQGPFMDSGWTFYQQRMTDVGLINGYPWPPIHVDHMEDTRSPRCIRSQEHQEYKRALRDMTLEQFTQELCVWRPSWMQANAERTNRLDETAAPDPVAHQGNGRPPSASGGIAIAHGAQSLLRSSNGHPIEGQTPGPRSFAVDPQKSDAGADRMRPNRMRFAQDFVQDFNQFDFHGPPFAFARFADGERAICMGQAIEGADGWRYAGGSSPLREDLLAALHYADPDYYLGISDGCCDPEAKEWYLREIRLPLAQVTFSNIFVNGNYSRFRQLDFKNLAIVASVGGDYWVPDDMLNIPFDIDRLVDRLLGVRRPILVSAGPSSCIIIHRYWLRANTQQRQVIVDVGSAIDELTKGRITRQYQVPGTRTAELVCFW
jgi:2-polyprenyl-3-methyl-5-hydroxy-6-metoxy-1,4-benzoquinol methylase